MINIQINKRIGFLLICLIGILMLSIDSILIYKMADSYFSGSIEISTYSDSNVLKIREVYTWKDSPISYCAWVGFFSMMAAIGLFLSALVIYYHKKIWNFISKN